MRIRYAFVSALLVVQAVCHAEVTRPLSSLRNEAKGALWTSAEKFIRLCLQS